MPAVDVADVTRRYWPLWLSSAVLLIVIVLFGTYLRERQEMADARAEKQRQAICAILANIPGHIPPEIAHARHVFARPGHDGDCQPIPKPKVTPLPSPTPQPTRTVVLVVPQASAGATSPRPAPSRSPSTKPAPKPTPTPSPSPTCSLQHPLKCLPKPRAHENDARRGNRR